MQATADDEAHRVARIDADQRGCFLSVKKRLPPSEPS